MTSGEAGFVLHPEARRDLVDIWEYIAEDDLVAAGRVRQSILDAIRLLVAFPQQGRIRPYLTSRPLRFHVVKNYLIAYAPKTAPLLVAAILRGRE